MKQNSSKSSKQSSRQSSYKSSKQSSRQSSNEDLVLYNPSPDTNYSRDEFEKYSLSSSNNSTINNFWQLNNSNINNYSQLSNSSLGRSTSRSNRNHGRYSSQNVHHGNKQFSYADQQRQLIAKENRLLVMQNPTLIDRKSVKTILPNTVLPNPINMQRECSIEICDCSSIDAAIQSNSDYQDKKICLLNFANPIKPGGGYLNGRDSQEQCLCRQTLLYPTIDGNSMYTVNRKNGSKPEASDIMIYSPNVFVIRDNNYNKIDPFKINIISSAAVDNRSGNIKNSSEIMKNRIRRIIMTAASENNDILILGAFGCGIFRNDPNKIAKSFHDVLVDEGFKSHFEKIIFPIYNNSQLYQIFDSTLKQ